MRCQRMWMGGAAGGACLVLAACGGGGSSASMTGDPAGGSSSGGFAETALVSDGVITAAHTDSKLQNPWGIAFAPGEPAWIADNGSSVATLYDGNGAPQSLVVSIPAGSNGPADPTGVIYNGTSDFVVNTGAGSGPAQFIYAGEGGTIAAWNGQYSGSAATTVYDDGAGGAVYKGLALASNGGANFLYATDLHNAKVVVFDARFNKVASAGGFSDSAIPAGFAPFGIQLVNGQLYVTYAQQNAAKNDENLGAGLGYVDVFDTAGNLVKHFASGGVLNAPWGIALAPTGFGPFGGSLLIGNFGDGAINVFDPNSGQSLGPLTLANGRQFLVPGLWALAFGNGAANQPTGTLFYTAGPNNQQDGIYGRIDLAAPSGSSSGSSSSSSSGSSSSSSSSSSSGSCTGYGC